MSQKDWSGMKFKLAEEAGDDMNIYFVDYNRETEESHLYESNHKYHDGAAFLKLYQAEKGIADDSWPILPVKKKPSLFKQLYQLVKFIKLSKPKNIRWKKREEIFGPNLGYHFGSFSVEETQAIKAFCRKKKISLTALMTWTLDRATSAFFLEEGSDRKWISPVNMRSKFTEIETYKNCSSSIIMNMSGSPSLEELNSDFKSKLKQGL